MHSTNKVFVYITRGDYLLVFHHVDFPEAIEYLTEAGYNPDFGARPLKRAIQRELQDPLALSILSGEFQEGDLIRVERADEGLRFVPSVQTVGVAG